MARNYFQYVVGAQSDENKGEVITSEFGDDQGNEMMQLVAQMICFYDCTDERVIKIVLNGVEVKYRGWQPDMVFEFYEVKSGKIVWGCCRPDWDH